MATRQIRGSLWLIGSLSILTLLSTPLSAQTTVEEQAAAIRTAGASLDDVRSIGVMPGDLAWTELHAMPGVRISYLLADEGGINPYTYRLRLPAGYSIPPHVSKARRFVTVLRGTYIVGFGPTADRSNAVAYPAGSFVWLPMSMPHYAWTSGETVIQVSGNGRFSPEWVKKK